MKESDLMQNVVIKQYANVNRFLPKVMKVNRKTTTELGREMGYVQSYISKLRTGTTQIKFDQVQELLERLPSNNELLQLEIAHQLFPIIPPVADGERFIGKDSLHASSRSLSELQEAITALKNSQDEFLDGDYTRVADPERAVDETLDAMFVTMNMLIVICHEFDFSLENRMSNRTKLWRKNKLVR